MKGVPGLLIALGLGIAGAVCNWFYMSQKARQLDEVQFIGFETNVKAGDVFQGHNFKKVPIPQMNAIRLKDVAPLASDSATVIGTVAYRDFQQGEILLFQDLKAPPGNDLKRDLGPNDEVIWVTVDARGFVPQFLQGGDEVSFIVPRVGAPPAQGTNVTSVPSTTEVIGPFYVLALGDLRGSFDRSRAVGSSQTLENVLAIRVTRTGPGQFEPKAQELLDRLRLSNNQALGIVMHSGKKPEKK